MKVVFCAMTGDELMSVSGKGVFIPRIGEMVFIKSKFSGLDSRWRVENVVYKYAEKEVLIGVKIV